VDNLSGDKRGSIITQAKNGNIGVSVRMSFTRESRGYGHYVKELFVRSLL